MHRAISIVSRGFRGVQRGSEGFKRGLGHGTSGEWRVFEEERDCTSGACEDEERTTRRIRRMRRKRRGAR
jgi:hypothetical protein